MDEHAGGFANRVAMYLELIVAVFAAPRMNPRASAAKTQSTSSDAAYAASPSTAAQSASGSSRTGVMSR